ncbi:MAG: hypothetical protein MUF78_03780 [Candidatus Edwardsbacteria bacterium]|nr:hypothetical protein [Candidatus Edwardsbacteria bacterium]
MRRLVLSLAVVGLICTAAAFAIPAKPGPRTFEQPDGSTFVGRLIGDEHYSSG